jgi:hypothetical protein
MIKRELDNLKRQISMKLDSAMKAPIQIRVLEYFPKENAVSIEVANSTLNAGGSGGLAFPQGSKFPLGQRADLSELMSPQVGDLGLLFYSGSQMSTGFVMLSYNKGTEQTNKYVPIRGTWGI